MKPGANQKSAAKTLLREIEVYRSHCLFVEAMKRAKELETLIRTSPRIKNKAKNLAALEKKREEIQKEAIAFDTFGASVQLTPTDRKRIKDVIASGCKEGSEAAIHETAIAMLVFGQYEDAIGEFSKLIDSDRFRVPAAKSIVRCFIAKSPPEEAVEQFHQWRASGDFPQDQLESVRVFLDSILKKKGLSLTLEAPEEAEELPTVVPEPLAQEPETLDLLSISIPYRDEYQKKKEALLDVHFQRGKTINIIVPVHDRALANYLQPGRVMEDIQVNAADLIYMESCVVHGRSRIRVGNNRGDYTVTLKMG